MSTRPNYVVGIDPGESTGVAVYSRGSGKLVVVETRDFWGAHDFMLTFPPEVAEVVVEVPGTFLYEAQTNAKAAMKIRKARDRKAVNVGGVRMMGELLARRFEQKGYRVRRVKPARVTKWTAEDFKRVTGWAGRSNAHERDAARLAWGL